ncbi:MAG TPA: oxidative damage protection protein [Candidatus Methylomirabilis sp.]|jgi:Fe-S cluster biosynthesis and repair protein YggX|nr:oxidative damage protection protein [Candidatus Methylomirabilis sp.]
MAQCTVKCVKLQRDLPGLDPGTPQGKAALIMAKAVGGEELKNRIQENVSMEAWKMWMGHLTMVINEYRLDPSSKEADEIIRQQMEDFFFGEGAALPPGYVPPQAKH